MLGSLVVGYLFCAGAGAGACCLYCIMAILIPRNQACGLRLPPGTDSINLGRCALIMMPPRHYRQLFAPGFALSCAMLVLGALFLLLDLGRPSAAPLLIVFPTPTFMTLGFWALMLDIATTGCLSLSWFVSSAHVRYRVVRATTWLALAAGIVVALYTGFLLSSMSAVPFWSSPWLPVLFLASSLSCGCALAIGCAISYDVISSFSGVFNRVVSLDALLLTIEALSAAALLASALLQPYDVAVIGAELLLGGSLSPLFLAGFAVVGVAVPLIIESVHVAIKPRDASFLLAAASCVLVGGFILRYCLVAVGAHPEVWSVIS